MRGEVQPRSEGVGWQLVCTGKARLKAGGGRARAECTWNMRAMVVTPEVSQLQMTALKFFKS